MSLKDRAAELARGETVKLPSSSAGLNAGAVPQDPATVPPAQPESLPDVDVDEPGPDGPEQVPVHVAWSRVMADVRKIAKGGEGGEYTGPGAYSFRGIDRTVNAFGPVLRKHGVLVLPVKVKPEWRDTRTANNKPTTETRVVVSWMVIGPAGDQLPMLLESAGEALDSGDKGTAKAQSIAQRVVLLTAAQVPTGDPDPDLTNVDRGDAPVRVPASYRDEALDLGTSRERMRQIVFELRQHRIYDAKVQNENGDDEAIGALVMRIGAERFPKASE